MNPTWQELADLLYQEANRGKVLLPTNLPADDQELLRALKNFEPRVYQICEHWSLTGEWLPFHPVEWWLLQFRLWHGWELAMRLSQKMADGNLLPTPTKPIALRWLLADSWLSADLEALVKPPTGNASPRIYPSDPGHPQRPD